MTRTWRASLAALIVTVQPAAAQEPSSDGGAPVFSPVTWERLVNAADEPHNWLMYRKGQGKEAKLRLRRSAGVRSMAGPRGMRAITSVSGNGS